MIKITVTMPFYNVAKHIDVMLDSLLHQTMDPDDFEVICVNDGSTDKSKEHVEKYQRVMRNLVLIDRMENSGGTVVGRNVAIEVARGEYIFFVDSDDFLGEETLERFYRAAKENQSDVLLGKYISVNGRGVAFLPFAKGNRPKAELIADHLLYAIAPHKMVRLAFLKERGLKFDPNAKAGNEDQLFCIQCYIVARVITVLGDYPYYFFIARGDENLSAKYVPAEDWMYVWHRVMEFLDEHVKDEAYKKKIKVVILNRLPAGTRFETFLLTARTTRAQKIEWLQAAKRFLDRHIEDELWESVTPHFRPFWQAAKANDIDKLEELSLSKKPRYRSTLNFVKTKSAGVVSYKRPSVHALPATTYEKAGVIVQVYQSIPGWFEIRRIAPDGTWYAEFIQRNDVHYTGKYWLFVLLNRMASLRRIKSKITRLLHKQ